MAQKKNDKFLNNNESLPVSITVDYTPEQASEMKRCMEDICYFAENYFYIVNLDHGRQKIKLFDAQRDAILDIMDHKRTIICASRQVGKALEVTTSIPTPSGWTTMGELKKGDMVFDAYGNPTKITHAHDIMYDRPCYKLYFSNGETMVADEDHQWFTQTRSDRKKYKSGEVRTTKEILQNLTTGKNEEPNHRIEIQHTLQYPEKELLIDPYLFGYWLGDGESAGSRLIVGFEDYEETFYKNLSHIENKRLLPLKNRSCYNISILKDFDNVCFKNKIKKMNVFKNKHIPVEYLQSSYDQRIALLQGLMDTDGYINTRGICQFYSTKKELADNVYELISSLGIQSSMTSKIPKIKNVEHSRVYIITFKTDLPVFRLSRKLDRINKVGKSRNNYVYIKKIEAVESVPVRCISVDNPEHLYLAGKSMIPTHNSTLLTIVCLWNVLFKKDYQVAILANKEDQAKEILERIKLSYEELPNWLKTGVAEFTKEVLKLVNGSKIFVSTTSESGIRGKSVNLLFVDEFAHIQTQIADPFFKSVMPTISSSKSAKIVLVSTPRGSIGKFYEIFKGAEAKKNGWCPVRIHYSQVPGRDEAWVKEQLASINYDMTLWQQEFEIEFLDNGTAAINATVIQKLKDMCYLPELSFDDGEYVVWKTPEPNRIISIGVDVAEGVGQDYTIAMILDITDPLDIQQVAMFSSNKMQPWVFAEKLNQIARSWGRPFLCIERNKEGGQVIDSLLNVHQYDNVLNFKMKNDTRNVYQSPGIFCHQNSKYTGIQNMKYFVETKQSVSLYDITSVNEMETFVRKVNKTWGAKPGYHDDRIMALTWALIPLEKHIAEEYLEVIEYDEAGKPVVIIDPNQNLSNLEFHNLKNRDKPIRDIGGGREFTPFFNVYTDNSPRILDKYQHMIEESSWEFV